MIIISNLTTILGIRKVCSEILWHINFLICFNSYFSFPCILDFGTTVSKLKRISATDEALGSDCQYTFIEDGHRFETDGATLKYGFAKLS